jgi:hypothetical protein
MITTTAIVGRSSGSVIQRKRWTIEAPSTFEAS